MFNSLRNQIVPKGRLAVRLAQVAAAISKRVDSLNDRVAELEAELESAATNTVRGEKRAVSRRRKTTRPFFGNTVETGLPPAGVIGNRLQADGRHCQELVGRTKAVLRHCLLQTL